MGKSDSLKFAVNRATLSGPKSKQHRIRQTANHFVKVLRKANMGIEKWTKVSNKHFQRVADAMRADGIGDGRIAEVFTAARHVCRAHGNDHISKSNAAFGVRRGSIANATSRAVAVEVFQGTLTRMRNDKSYPHAGRAAAQIDLMYNVGLRREESAKLDLPNDWDRENHSLRVQYGTKGGRPRTLYDLSPQQEAALKRAEKYVSPSDRKGINNLMPEGMGDEWLHRLNYAARKHGLTGKDAGGTLHGLRQNGSDRCIRTTRVSSRRTGMKAFRHSRKPLRQRSGAIGPGSTTKRATASKWRRGRSNPSPSRQAEEAPRCSCACEHRRRSKSLRHERLLQIDELMIP